MSSTSKWLAWRIPSRLEVTWACISSPRPRGVEGILLKLGSLYGVFAGRVETELPLMVRMRPCRTNHTFDRKRVGLMFFLNCFSVFIQYVHHQSLAPGQIVCTTDCKRRERKKEGKETRYGKSVLVVVTQPVSASRSKPQSSLPFTLVC
jgi:hypothetical protein